MSKVNEHECPTCDRAFGSDRAMHVHHTKGHGESLVKKDVNCHGCGVKFETYPNPGRSTERHFCSSDCRLEWMDSWKGENHPRSNSFDVECDYCGDSLRRPAHRIECYDMQFCSPECQGGWRSERTGSDHPLWDGGRPDYGEGWNSAKRAAVRERDGHECQGCGMVQPDHLNTHNRLLDVHHIVPAKSFDDPLKRNATSNLVTLCLSCHRKAERMAPLYPFAD